MANYVCGDSTNQPTKLLNALVSKSDCSSADKEKCLSSYKKIVVNTTNTSCSLSCNVEWVFIKNNNISVLFSHSRWLLSGKVVNKIFQN